MSAVERLEAAIVKLEGFRGLQVWADLLAATVDADHPHTVLWRTIDAQLAILRNARSDPYSVEIALADAILGDAS